MFDFGPHAPFIWACYAVVVVVHAAVIVWLLQDGRRQARRIADLEARGIRRRSASA